MTGNDQSVNMGKKFLVKNLEPWRLKIPGDEQPVLAIELFYKAHLIAVDQIFVTTQMQWRCNSWHPCSQ